MIKKIVSILLMFIIILSSLVIYATETTLTTTDTVEDLTNIPLVDSTVSDELLIAPAPENEENKDVSSNIYQASGNRVLFEEIVSLKNISINGNLVIFAETVDLQELDINGDVAIFARQINANNVTVLNGVTVLAAENINLNMYSTEGNIYIASETVNALTTARGLYYIARKVDISADSIIDNLYNLQELLPEDDNEEVIYTTSNILKDKAYNILVILVKTFFVSGFILLFSTEFINKTKTNNIVKYLGFSVIKGAGWSIIIPIFVMVLLFSGIAIGVSFALFVLYIIIFWASIPFVSIAIMNEFSKEEDSKFKKLVLILCIAFLIKILGYIPILGTIITILVEFAGMGIVIGSLKNSKNCYNCNKNVKLDNKKNYNNDSSKIDEDKNN